MNSQFKNILIGVVVGGVVVVGGYAFFNDEKNLDFYIRTDDPTETRAFLESGEEDKDCADFSTQDEAQEFFESEGGPSSDSHNLDRDGDGVVCETLP